MLAAGKNVTLFMLAIIGGSGLYELDGLRIEHERRVTTPFGDPSSTIVQGTYHDQGVLFIARHGASRSRCRWRRRGCAPILCGDSRREQRDGPREAAPRLIPRPRGASPHALGDELEARAALAQAARHVTLMVVLVIEWRSRGAVHERTQEECVSECPADSFVVRRQSEQSSCSSGKSLNA